MASGAKKGDEEDIADALALWRQGDFALDVGPFFFADLTDDGSDNPYSPIEETESVFGFVVISQTCDIVRYDPETEYNFVTVAPLVEINNDAAKLIAKGRTPHLVRIENAPNVKFVVDLRRAMTVSKELLASWQRVDGFNTAESRANFGHSIERNYGRFAFPGPFVDAIAKFSDRVKEKHDKESDFGRIYRSIFSIRARAAPHWEAEEKEIAFLIFLANKENREATWEEIDGEIRAQVDGIKLPPGYKWSDPKKLLGTLSDFPARDWIESFAIDLEFLSSGDN